MRLIFDKKKLKYNKETNTITCSERDVPIFNTTHTVVGNNSEMVFDYKESTGSEWDATTKSIYEAKNGMKLVVQNDAEICKQRADAYVRAKTRY